MSWLHVLFKIVCCGSDCIEMVSYFIDITNIQYFQRTCTENGETKLGIDGECISLRAFLLSLLLIVRSPYMGITLLNTTHAGHILYNMYF